MIKKVLLIGGTGFVGKHMKKLFQRAGHDVTSTGREKDIRNITQIDELIKSLNPDVVINFAALTTVKETFESPIDTYKIGFLGTYYLLDSLKKNKFKGVFLNISSSEVYGFPEEGLLPITEETEVRPMSPYSVNKISTEMLCYQWSKTESFKIISTRPFTHIGPGQSNKFAISNFAKQIAEIELGQREPSIYVGNTHTTRDITDVRDVILAYESLIEYADSGEVYNVCSNSEVSIRELLEYLIGLSSKKITIEQDPAMVRSAEQLRVVGSYTKINKKTGWEPKIAIEKTLKDIYDYWITQVKL